MTKLEDLTVVELRDRARKRNLVGYSKLNKAELVALVRNRKSPTAKLRCKRSGWIKSRSKKNRACRKPGSKRVCRLSGSKRNKSTRRCRKRKCSRGYERGKGYVHHKSQTRASRCRKKCPAGKVRDPVTGRCRNRKKPGRKPKPANQ